MSIGTSCGRFLGRFFRAVVWHGCVRWRFAALAWLQKRRSARAHRPTISGLGAVGVRRGKALLTYIVDPFLPEFDPRDIHIHSNRWKSRELGKILSELGYDVDVTDWENYHPPSAKEYDVVFGHGVAYERACQKPAPKCKKIFLGAIACMDQLIAEENRRLKLLKQRRGLKLERRYFGNFKRDLGPARSDAMILLGTDWVIDTYRQYSHLPTYRWCNVVVDDVPVGQTDKNYATARKHFLWMSGYAAVHRGLDIVLEVFAGNPDLHLWVCGSIVQEKKFVAEYQRELNETPNIHFVGWIDVSSAQYREIVKTCAYCVYPSGSDAMAGALVNQMATGLVPIYTKEAGTDCGGFGTQLSQFTHQELERCIRDAASADVAKLHDNAVGVSHFACQFYSKERFRQDFTAALKSILNID
jgi:hypothetical protein